MEGDRIWIREEIRMLGAIQIMNAVLHHCLGLIWTYLLMTQIIAFRRVYIPLTLLTGYPYWSSIFFINSGTCAIILERRREMCLVTYTVVASIVSACIASIGTLFLLFEFLAYNLNTAKVIWPWKCGQILSEYLFLFTLLELTVASTVAHWGIKATSRRS